MTNSRYCPVHNPFGTFKDTNGKNWYESSYPINSVFDAHQNVGTALARPDSKNKGVLYKDQFIELHTTIQEDTLFEAEKRRSEYYAGKGGVSGLVSTSALDGATTTATFMTLPILSNNSSLVIDVIGDPSQYVSADSTYTVPTTVSITDMPTNTLVWDEATSKMYKAKVATNDIDANGVPVPLFTDDIGWEPVQKGYPESWLNRLSLGKPLIGMYSNLVSNQDGHSMIPNSTSNTNVDIAFKTISNPTLTGTTNAGGSWNVSATPVRTTNDYTIGTDVTLVDIVTYTKANNPMTQSTPKPITYVSPKVVNSNSHSVYQSALVTNSITGGIATSNELVKFESKVLENGDLNLMPDLKDYPVTLHYGTDYGKKSFLYDGKYYYYNGVTTSNIKNIWGDLPTSASWLVVDNIIEDPTSLTPTLTSSTSKASKSFYSKAIEGSKHYDMIFGQEIIDNSGYNSTKFTNLTNGATLDDVGTTVNTKVLAKQLQYRR